MLHLFNAHLCTVFVRMNISEEMYSNQFLSSQAEMRLGRAFKSFIQTGKDKTTHTVYCSINKH